MEDSILKTIKQLSGVSSEDAAFDLDLITYINGVLVDLNDLGVGPVNGFMIEDETETWTEFFAGTVNPVFLNNVKTYVALKVRMYFDPPTASYHTTAMKEQIEEIGWRINTRREALAWPEV